MRGACHARWLVAFGLVWMAATALASEPAWALGDSVSADGCALAVGGDISESDIKVICDIPPAILESLVAARVQDLRDLSDNQKEIFGLLREKLQVSEGQIRAALEAAGEASVPPERIAARLVEIAQRYRDLKAQLAISPGDAPETEKLKAAALEAVEAGDLERADGLLKDLVAVEDALLDKRALAAAAARSKRAEEALLRLRYLDAADLYGAAADRVPPGHDAERWDYRRKRADALYRQGSEFGDNAALDQSIQGWRTVLAETDRLSAPDAWAGIQYNLGNALQALGGRESGTARLEEAVVAYRSALEEFTRARVPLKWAMTQNNLGAALQALGERESGTARLEEAVVAYRSALEERTRARVPLKWAATQYNLGIALSTLGERENGTARLEEAVVAYRSALEELTRARVPLKWAGTQNNLGLALEVLGRRTQSIQTLQNARKAFEKGRVVYREAYGQRYEASYTNTLAELDKEITGLSGSK